MEDILSHIGNYGFPMVVSIFLLVRIEGKLNLLSESIIKLSNTIDRL